MPGIPVFQGFPLKKSWVFVPARGSNVLWYCKKLTFFSQWLKVSLTAFESWKSSSAPRTGTESFWPYSRARATKDRLCERIRRPVDPWTNHADMAGSMNFLSRCIITFFSFFIIKVETNWCLNYTGSSKNDLDDRNGCVRQCHLCVNLQVVKLGIIKRSQRRTTLGRRIFSL